VLLCGCHCLLLSLLYTSPVSCPAIFIHGIDGCQTHHTPHPLVRVCVGEGSPGSLAQQGHLMHNTWCGCNACAHQPPIWCCHMCTTCAQQTGQQGIPNNDVDGQGLPSNCRATHTPALQKFLQMHALCSGHSIQHQPLMHFFKLVIPYNKSKEVYWRLVLNGLSVVEFHN